MIFPAVGLELFGQRELTDGVVSHILADCCTGQTLEAKGEVPWKSDCEHWFEEHAITRILVVLNESSHRWSRKNGRVVGIKGKEVIPLFDSCMKGSPVASVEK